MAKAIGMSVAERAAHAGGSYGLAAHRVPVRRAQRAHRDGRRRLHAPPSASGVPALSETHRQGDSGRSRPAPDPRQLRHPQDGRGPALARGASAPAICTSPRPRPPGSTWSSASSPRSPNSASAAASSTASPTWRRRSMDYLEQHNADPKPFVWTGYPPGLSSRKGRPRETSVEVDTLAVPGGSGWVKSGLQHCSAEPVRSACERRDCHQGPEAGGCRHHEGRWQPRTVRIIIAVQGLGNDATKKLSRCGATYAEC